MIFDLARPQPVLRFVQDGVKVKIHLYVYVAYAACKYVTFSTFNALNIFAEVQRKSQVNLIIFKWYDKKFKPAAAVTQ